MFFFFFGMFLQIGSARNNIVSVVNLQLSQAASEEADIKVIVIWTGIQ